MPGKFPVSVRWSSKRSQGDPELVLSVPKKSVKTAAARNLLKRRLRAIFRPFLDKSKILRVFASAGSDKLTFAELRRGLEEIK